LILKLLVIDPEKRLGYGESDTGYPSIRNHPFFQKIVWDTLDQIEMPVFSPFEEETITSFAKDLLEPGETIVLEGIVARKRFLSWKDRLLILTNQKRIVVFNIEKQTIKTSIPVNPALKVVVNSDEKHWTLTWPKNNTLTLKCPDTSASLWGSNILREIIGR
jgi:hypothetical protein